MRRLRLAPTVFILLSIACTRSKEVSVAYMSSWEPGEVKTCTEGKFKGEDAMILLCDPQAGAAFYMTVGGMDSLKDPQQRSKMRDLFAGYTKTFKVVFERRSDGVPVWNCTKTERGLDCKAP